MRGRRCAQVHESRVPERRLLRAHHRDRHRAARRAALTALNRHLRDRVRRHGVHVHVPEPEPAFSSVPSASLHSLYLILFSVCSRVEFQSQGLASVGRARRLRELVVSECLAITDVGVQKLAQQCKQIEALDISLCRACRPIYIELTLQNVLYKK